MINHMLSFIFGSLAITFVKEKEWWCVGVVLVLELINVYTQIKKQNEDDFKKTIIKYCAWIYVLVGDEKMSSGMDISLKKEISKLASEMAARCYGANSVVPWMKEVLKYKKHLEEKNNEDNN